MAVEQLRSWQHDIAERADCVADEIVDEYIDAFPDTPDEIVHMRNNVLKLRALVQYSIMDNERAKMLMTVLRKRQRYLYQDLYDYGPRGKTGNLLNLDVIMFVAM